MVAQNSPFLRSPVAWQVKLQHAAQYSKFLNLSKVRQERSKIVCYLTIPSQPVHLFQVAYRYDSSNSCPVLQPGMSPYQPKW
jgi:hypothetical protein